MGQEFDKDMTSDTETSPPEEKPQKLNRANRRKYVHNVTHPDRTKRVFRDGVWQLLRPTKGFRRMTQTERIEEARQVAIAALKAGEA
jgi:hypothetical protein